MANTRNQQFVVIFLVIIGLTTLITTAARAQDVLPRPPQPFKGKIGHTVKDSTPDFPQEPQAPAGAPNILLIMTDDADADKATRVMQALFMMSKIDIARLQQAYNPQ